MLSKISFKNSLLVILIVFFLFFLSSPVKGVRIYTAGPSFNENLTWEQNLTDVYRGSLNLGDIDNDGDLDLALTGRGSIISKIYENNGTSFRENETWQQNLTGVYRSSTAFGDIDNDGDLDLILTGCNENTEDNCFIGSKFSKIYENNGTSFRENETWQQNLTAIYRGTVTFGDIDNDGDLDLILSGGSSNGRISKIYENNGTSFTENQIWQQNLTAVYESMVVLGDINNDSYIDLILSGEDSGSNKISKIYINNKTSFIESYQWYQNLQNVDQGTLVLMDFDNDGDLDLDLTGCCDYNRLYHNNGTSFVLNQSEALGAEDLPSSFDGSVSFGDYDNDGDLDTAVTGREGKSYIFNNNYTHFDIINSNIFYPTQLMWSTIVFGDIDNDTNLDLIQMGGTVTTLFSEIYINNLTNNPNEQPNPPVQFTNYTTTSGNIHLGWGNGSDNETPSSGLYYNIRLGSSSGSNDIISGVYGGGEDNGYFGNMMQRKNITLKSDRLSASTKYFWSVQVIDTGLQKSAWSDEQSFNISGDITLPNITLNTPINYFNTTSYTITFNITAFDNSNITNVTLYGNWTGTWEINETNSSGFNGTDYIFTLDLTKHGNGFYKWEAETCDNFSLCKTSANQTFLIDTIYPEINLISLENNSISSSNTNTFNYNVSDLRIVNCSLIINNKVNLTDTTIAIDTEQSFTQTLKNDVYNWSINCTDSVNQMNNSLTYALSVNEQTNSISGGGISSSAGIRAVTKVEQPKEEQKQEIKPAPKPSPKPSIQTQTKQTTKLTNKFTSAIQTIKEKIKSSIQTIFAFLFSLFIILSYTWIIKEDFKR